MATARGRTKKATQLIEAKPLELLLLEVRYPSINAERFMPPELTKRGKLRRKRGRISVGFEKGDNEIPGVISFALALEGLPAESESEKNSEQKQDAVAEKKEVLSFTIAIEVEGLVILSGSPVDDDKDLTSLLRNAVKEMHVIATEKLKYLANDMGFKIRPTLGMTAKQIHSLEFLSKKDDK